MSVSEESEVGAEMPRIARASSSADALDLARRRVHIARSQFKADLSRASSAGKGVARRAWVQLRPAVAVGGAIVGAVLVYRLLTPRRATPASLIRIVLVTRDKEAPSRWLQLVRSAGLTLGTALVRSILSRVASQDEVGATLASAVAMAPRDEGQVAS